MIERSFSFKPSENITLSRPTLSGGVERSTYALWVVSGVDSNGEFAKYWQPIEELGYTYEGAGSQLLSVDVPASTNVTEAFRLMQFGEDAGVWHFQEQNYAHATAV